MRNVMTREPRRCRKDTILEIYAALAATTQSCQPYQTRLNPGPVDPRMAHPTKGKT